MKTAQPMKKTNKAKPVDVYLISSTLHFFWAFMLASKNKPYRESHLIAIDQYANKPLLMMKYLVGEVSPFATTETWAGRELKGLDKIQNRKHEFVKAQNYIKTLKIDRAYIGNDRSVIAQYFLKHLKQNHNHTKACFLDDGVYSYLGREASKHWTEKYSNAFFKKLAYGFWYDVPATVGASKWIDEVWVMYPELVNQALQKKNVREILPTSNGFEELKPLSEKVFRGIGVDEKKLQKLDILITLPNESVFSKFPDYSQHIRLLVSALISKGKQVGIKYHPASGKKDLLNLEKLGAIKILSNLNYELLIPYLENCTVIGDFSTTVLISHYSEKICVKMLALDKIKEESEMANLCRLIGIQVQTLNSIKQTYKLLK